MILELLHLADSALPVGAAAHSFGLETLVEDEILSPSNLAPFLQDYLGEAAPLEAGFVRRAWQGADPVLLTREFQARRIARESRDAGTKMGRRLARLVNSLLSADAIRDGLTYPVVFGLAARRMGIFEEETILAYLNQGLTGLISACQRLMPLGQVEASCLLWDLRPALRHAAERSITPEVSCFTPLLELASARHTTLETRLFIS